MNGPTNNPETNKLFAELGQAVRDGFEVPNECLPKRFRDERGDAVSLSALERKMKKDQRIQSEHDRIKAEKARRVEQYAAQLVMEPSCNGEPELIQAFEYDVDEDRQYMNELKFCEKMVAVGIMSDEDFE